MKITEMLHREDFLKINKETLEAYYGNCGGAVTLYIYPMLNAIVVRSPSKKVLNYLLTEYDVRANFLKRLAVKGYVWACLRTRGIMAARSIRLNNTANKDTLIYPCNRKYRIFDFSRDEVSVQIKSGFPTRQLRHEIEFRSKIGLPDFVPALVKCTKTGYTEKIIDGKPLARISDGYDRLKNKAFALLQAYASEFTQTVSANEYINKLKGEADKYAAHLETSQDEIYDLLYSRLKGITTVDVTFSHGDLQPGNIWIENGTEKVYIIDWESWGTRSCFYDKAALFDGLRPGEIDGYLHNKSVPMNEKVIVIMEDIIFQLEECQSLPEEFGLERVKRYMENVQTWIKEI